MAEHKAMVHSLGFNNQIQSPATGNSGGIVIMWDNTSLCVQGITIHPQGIDVEIKVHNPPFFFFFSTIYASTDFDTRLLLWDHLCNFADSHISPDNNPWIIGGHFNEVLRASEKYEGNNINRNKVSAFRTASTTVTLVTWVSRVVSLLGQTRDIEMGDLSSWKGWIGA